MGSPFLWSCSGKECSMTYCPVCVYTDIATHMQVFLVTPCIACGNLTWHGFHQSTMHHTSYETLYVCMVDECIHVYATMPVSAVQQMLGLAGMELGKRLVWSAECTVATNGASVMVLGECAKWDWYKSGPLPTPFLVHTVSRISPTLSHTNILHHPPSLTFTGYSYL